MGNHKEKSTFSYPLASHTHTHTFLKQTAFCSFLPSVQKVWVRSHTQTHRERKKHTQHLYTPAPLDYICPDEWPVEKNIVKIECSNLHNEAIFQRPQGFLYKVIEYLSTVWRTSIQEALEKLQKKTCSLNMKASVCFVFAVVCWIAAQAEESPKILTLSKVMNELNKINQGMVSWLLKIYGWLFYKNFTHFT